jgi:hypothetical protein
MTWTEFATAYQAHEAELQAYAEKAQETYERYIVGYCQSA